MWHDRVTQCKKAYPLVIYIYTHIRLYIYISAGPFRGHQAVRNILVTTNLVVLLMLLVSLQPCNPSSLVILHLLATFYLGALILLQSG